MSSPPTVAVIAGDAARGTYVDVLAGAADFANGPDDEGAFAISTSIGIAWGSGSEDVSADIEAPVDTGTAIVAADLGAE